MNKALTLAAAAFAVTLASGAQAQILGGGGGLGSQLGGGLGGGLSGATGSFGGAGSVSGGLAGSVDGSRLRSTTGDVMTHAERRAQAAQARASAAAERNGRRAGNAVTGARGTLEATTVSGQGAFSGGYGADGQQAPAAQRQTSAQADVHGSTNANRDGASVSVGANASASRRPNP